MEEFIGAVARLNHLDGTTISSLVSGTFFQ